MTAYFKHNTISLPLPKFAYLEFERTVKEYDGTYTDVYEVIVEDPSNSKHIKKVEQALENDPNCIQYVP
jgi:hypothetical protein